MAGFMTCFFSLKKFFELSSFMKQNTNNHLMKIMDKSETRCVGSLLKYFQFFLCSQEVSLLVSGERTLPCLLASCAHIPS
ncbi:hypothetical protein, partial [Alkalicoccus saliphilus]|uniref:hypothetical protein n=1 Tax=Alkalicoccus saliphilus TaxID=200989 RepID=UPI001C3F5517